jgi:hypothetical protein
MSNQVYPANVRGLTFTVVKRPEFSTLIQQSPNKYELRLPQTQNPIWHWSLVYDYLKDYDIQGGLSYTDLQRLMGFFAARQGRFDDFLFEDPDDHSVGPAILTTAWEARKSYYVGDSILDSNGHWQKVTTAGPSGLTEPTWNSSGGTTNDGTVVWTDQGSYPGGFPNLKAELQLVTDGVTWFSPVQRNLGGQFYEDITNLKNGIAVYANGALQVEPDDYVLDGPGLAIPGKSFAGAYLQWTSEPAAPITAEFDFYFRVRFEEDAQDFEKFLSQLWTIGGHGQRGSGEVRLISCRPQNEPLPEPAQAQVCPPIVGIPIQTCGPRRTLIYPEVTGLFAGDNPCGACSGPCGAATASGGSGTLALFHGGPLVSGPHIDWGNFVLPSYIDPGDVCAIWLWVIADYVPDALYPAAFSVGWLWTGSPGFWNAIGGWSSRSNTQVVAGPYTPANLDLSTLTVRASLASSTGGQPCDEDNYATLTLGVFVDWNP